MNLAAIKRQALAEYHMALADRIYTLEQQGHIGAATALTNALAKSVADARAANPIEHQTKESRYDGSRIRA